MGYENAPATALVATDCACCGRPLVDAVSVETGIGPVCRAKHGYSDAQAPAHWGNAAVALRAHPELQAVISARAPEARDAANAIVHRIACEQGSPAVPSMIAAVYSLGFQTLALRIAGNLTAAIRVTRDSNGLLAVKAPFSEAFNMHVRRCRGQRWDGARKVRTVPASERAALWGALKASYPAGTIVAGENSVAVL